MNISKRVHAILRNALRQQRTNRFVPRANSVAELLLRWDRQTHRGYDVEKLSPSARPAVRLAREEYKPYYLADVHRSSRHKLFIVVSLFAGAGGSSLGYRLSGGDVRGAVEFGPAAAASYRRNNPGSVVFERNVRDILNGEGGVERFLRALGLSPGELDILDASPPCTEFSLAGNGIGDQTVPKTHSGVKQTNVATLPFDYARLLHRVRAKVSVMENVPGLAIRTPALLERILDALRFNERSERLYYVNWRTLTASAHGVPQKRKRIIVVSVRKDIAEAVGLVSDEDVLRVFPKPTSGRVSIRSALRNLEQTARDIRPFTNAMRLSSTRHLLGDLCGPPSKHRRLRSAATNFSLVRCCWDLPAPTLVIAGQQPDYRAGTIHPMEDRKFTVPELKRLFGLPDDFQLEGTVHQAVEAICNMVPPFLTRAIANSIHEKILKPHRDRTDLVVS